MSTPSGDKVHYFQINYNNQMDYYTLIVEGDKDEIEQFLQRYSNDVRYNTSKDKSKNDNGSNEISPGIIIRNCMWNYDATRKRSHNRLPPDNRQAIWEGGDANEGESDDQRPTRFLN